jgi:hypothetical protein
MKKENQSKSFRLYKHKESGEIYRITGACVNTDSDEYCVLYQPWNDFGDDPLKTYCKEYKSFHRLFDEYEHEGFALVPTAEQCKKNLAELEKKLK